ncbi:MAG: hypothetical protein IAE93_07145 [Ignavibacteria bacterium]|nr:hypothetical protein [Ignavibacteria bacterium]
MKTNSFVNQAETLLEDYKSSDRRKIFREDLGQKSLKEKLSLYMMK